MKHKHNNWIVWVVVAAAILVGLYLAKDKLADWIPGMRKDEVVEVTEVVETPESTEVTEAAGEPMGEAMPEAQEK